MRSESQLNGEIDETDQEVDRMVYELYTAMKEPTKFTGWDGFVKELPTKSLV
ncbi:MAG: hypothetical protein GIS02_01230 [Methanosarcinales archaeon]|uniref:Uncharacterized protein n=1 Tax=Candidatus Ethanoperedens thermophilum TaxID=2766897 RepID=A0A848D994_9EURY|nr:hypothetical protein [Candidatus Ethanoperedens thermophilum]